MNLDEVMKKDDPKFTTYNAWAVALKAAWPMASIKKEARKNEHGSGT
jgi:hypothetical protein